MDSQQLEAWMLHNQHQYYQPQYHASSIATTTAGGHELSPEMPPTPSLSGSPILSEQDTAAISQLYYNAYTRNSVSEDTKFQYPQQHQYPMTPSDLGSSDDAYAHHSHHHHQPQSLAAQTPAMDISSFTAMSLASPLSITPMAIGPSNMMSTGGSSASLAQHSRSLSAASSLSSSSKAADRNHATSGRRRAQNRAAQRAFRERKEKHARDLETALAALTHRYQSLESSHAELSAAYEKLRMTVEILTKDDDGDDGDDDGALEGSGRAVANGSVHSKETLRKLLEIVHGQMGERAAAIKKEEEVSGSGSATALWTS